MPPQVQDSQRPNPPGDHPQESWTLVKSKSRRRQQSNAHLDAAHAPSPPPRTDRVPRSVGDITSEYRAVRAQWDESECCCSLRSIVAAGATSLACVSQAVCLGIGSFDPPDGGWEAKRKTYLQLISFLVIVEELEKCLGIRIPCLFQEPIFTANDEGFLSNLGHRVVVSPLACDSVDRDTLLFGVHLYRPLYAMALQTTAPAIFIGTGWDVWDQVDLSPKPGTELMRLQEMEETYAKFAFPQDLTTTAFSSTSIYFRPSVL